VALLNRQRTIETQRRRAVPADIGGAHIFRWPGHCCSTNDTVIKKTENTVVTSASTRIPNIIRELILPELLARGERELAKPNGSGYPVGAAVDLREMAASEQRGP
jgi:hypothetical protein